MANLNTSTFSGIILTQYEKRLLARALPKLLYGRWADRPTLKRNGVWSARKYNAVSANTTALVEGSTPAESSAISYTTVTITPTFYGAYLIWTDIMPLEVYDEEISLATGFLGETAGLSADTIMRDNIVANATIDYSGDQAGRTTLASPVHDISFTDLIKNLAALENEGAQPADGDCFPVICSPHTWATLMLDPIFVSMFVQEPGNTAIRTGYMGRLLNMRFYVTSNAKEYTDGGLGSTVDVYTATIIGRGSIAALGLAGYPDVDMNESASDADLSGQQIDPVRRPVEIIAKQPGSAGSLDPLNQRGSIGYKFVLTPKVVNSSWIRVLEHTTVFSNE